VIGFEVEVFKTAMSLSARHHLRQFRHSLFGNQFVSAGAFDVDGLVVFSILRREQFVRPFQKPQMVM